MARIENQTVYPIKSSPVSTDYFVITDSEDNNATKNVYIGALQASLGSTIYTASNVIDEDRVVTHNDSLTFDGAQVDSEFIVQNVSGPTFILDNTGIFATSMGIGGTSNDPSAIFQVDSTTQGFLPPRMTEAQKNAIVSPAEGLVIFNTDSGVLESYNGSTWTSNSDTNIYTTDGGIVEDRTVSISNAGSLEIVAAGSIVNSFSSLNIEENVISMVSTLNADSSSIVISNTAMTITDTINSRGLQYAADYSANFVDRSLVDKAYVDNLPSADTIYTADGEITDESRTVTLDDTNDSGEVLTFQTTGTGNKVSSLVVGAESASLLVSDTTVIGLSITPASAIFTDSFNNKGLQYAADYSANFTARSLVDKAYVDQASGNIYTEDGTIDTVNRLVTGEGNSTLTINMYDTDAGTFTTRGRMSLTATSSNMSFSTGNGAGSVLNQMQLRFTSASMLVTDEINSRGLQYAADYSANFVDRSLVDKAYVDVAVSGVDTLYSADGTISEDRTVTLDNGNLLNFSTPGGVRNLLSLFNSEGDSVSIDADSVNIAATNNLSIYLDYLAPPTDGQLLGYDGVNDYLVWYTPSVPTGLEALDEGNGIGWRLIGKSAANYGNIGSGAVDLSQSSGASATRGATGQNSFAEGQNTTASGLASHAEGSVCVASGSYSHAEGALTVASANYSHAEGNGTDAIAQNAHSEGRNTLASGVSSHAEGDTTQATGDYSHSEGADTVAGGQSAHAEGDETQATGDYSHSEGSFSIASGIASHAGGFSNRARSYSEVAVGVCGTDYTPISPTAWNLADRIFNVGIGANTSERSDAFTILKNGRVGIGIDNFEAEPSLATLNVNGSIQTGGYTVATLPAGTIGMRSYVTDSTVAMSTNFGAVVAGGGSNVVPVFYDGTDWRIG